MAPKVEKKYVKIGIASLAVVALVIGLSVGLTQNNKNGANTAASSSATGLGYDEGMYAHCSTSGKSGKSGGDSSAGGSGKSGKSGGSGDMSMGGSGKSGKSGGGSSKGGVYKTPAAEPAGKPEVYNEEVDEGDMMMEVFTDDMVRRTRRLVVPGAKDYVAVMDKNTGGKRRKLRTELIKGKRGLEGMDWGGSSGAEKEAGSGAGGSDKSGSTKSGTDKSGSTKSGTDKSGSTKSGSPKSGSPKSGSPKSGSAKSDKSGSPKHGSSKYCPTPNTNICTGKSGKYGGGSSSGGKSGKSGGGSSKGGDDDDYMTDDVPIYCSTGKSGKSGGSGSGKSGKSGGISKGGGGSKGGSSKGGGSKGGSSKGGGKSSSEGTDDDCTPKPSPAPSICDSEECTCDDILVDNAPGYILNDGECVLILGSCGSDDAMTLDDCCDAQVGDACSVNEAQCAPSIPPPSPTFIPPTPPFIPPTPPFIPPTPPSPTFIPPAPTPSPTEQGTTTVAKETEEDDTQTGDRGSVRV